MSAPNPVQSALLTAAERELRRYLDLENDIAALENELARLTQMRDAADLAVDSLLDSLDAEHTETFMATQTRLTQAMTADPAGARVEVIW